MSDRSLDCVYDGTWLCNVYRNGLDCDDCPIDCIQCETKDCVCRDKCGNCKLCKVETKAIKFLKKNGWRLK